MLRQKGMTLIELMITLAIFAILIAIAAPSFNDTIKGNRIESGLRELAGNLKFARSEAVNTQRTITICHLDSGGTPSCDGVWSDGLTIFFDDDADGDLENAADIIRVTQNVGANALTVNDLGGVALNLIQFGARGTANSKATIKLCDASANVKHARAILLESTGMAMNSRLNTATNVHKDINNVDLSC